MNKSKPNFDSLRKLFVYCKKYGPIIIFSILLAIGGTFCSIVGPDKMKTIVNKIVEGITSEIELDVIIDLGLGLLAIYGVGAILSYGEQLIMSVVTQKVAKSLRSSIIGKINKLQLNYFDTTSKGDILSIVTNDIDIISQMLNQNIASLISGIVLFVATIIMMFKTNLVLSLATTISSIVGFTIIAVIASKSQKYFVQNQEGMGLLNGYIEEVYANHQEIKSYNGQKRTINEFINYNNSIYMSNFKSQFLSGCMVPIMTLTGNISYAMIFIVGVFLILNGSIYVTLGTITAFIFYAKLFSQSLTNIVQVMLGLQQASAASDRVFKILEVEEMAVENYPTIKVGNIKGHVKFKNVKFGYIPEREIIHDFSLDVKAGQKVAIVGPTGAGKSTIVNLLMSFYELNSGDITIDDISINKITRENVHDMFDMILQDTWLFQGTIRENIIYNKSDVSDEYLNKICSAVGLGHFISTLPNGYDTVLDDTVSISEGQKQQLTIARAMVKDAPLLILDEATSSVDSRTEKIIQEAMDELTKDRTSFVIAHRLSTIKNADIILVMNAGDIIEKGSHEELMNINGFYANLYNSQFDVA